jgi:hypothetical protein
MVTALLQQVDQGGVSESVMVRRSGFVLRSGGACAILCMRLLLLFRLLS